MRLTDLAAKQEREPEPECTARRSRPRPGFDVDAMEAFENALKLEIQPGQVRGRRQPLEIVCSERRRLIGTEESVVGVTPRATFVALTAQLKSINHPKTRARFGHHLSTRMGHAARLRECAVPDGSRLTRTLPTRLPMAAHRQQRANAVLELASIERLELNHVPQNTPVMSAKSIALTSCRILMARAPHA